MIKTLKNNLANILPILLNIIDKLNKKVIFLVKAINKAIDTFTLRAKLCLRLVLGFDKKCNGAQIEARKFKKTWKK